MDGALPRLYAATFLYAFAMALGIPLVPELLNLKYDATDAFIGVVVGVYGVMQIFLRLPMGDMADRRGRRRSLLLAFACVFISGVFFTFERGPLWTIPGVAFFGFAGGIFWVAANSYLFDRVSHAGDAARAPEPPRERIRVTGRRVSLADEESLRRPAVPDPTEAGPEKPDIARATSDYTLMISAALLLGPLVGHYLAEHFSFRAAFSTFMWSAVAGFALILTLPEAPRPYRPNPSGSPYTRAWGLLRNPALVLSAVGTFLYGSLFATMNAFFQLHVLAVGFTLVAVGYLLAWRQASALLIRLGLPPLLRRFGSVRALFASIAVAGVATALVPFATDTVTLALVVTLFGAATGVMIPANLMLVNEGAPEQERGLAYGIYGTMLGLGQAVAPLTFGFIATLLASRAWSFWAAAVVAVLGVAVIAGIQLQRAREADAAAA